MMNKTYILLALLAISSNLVYAHSYTEDQGVLVLTDANFDQAIKEFPQLLVEFYAPWCGHCKALAPEYVKAAATLKNNDPPLYIAQVDATEQKKVAGRYGISGYPSLKFFNKGKPIDYNGGRNEKEIVEYVIKKSGKISTALFGASAVQDYIKAQHDKNNVVLVYFGESQNDEEFKVFKEAGLSYDQGLEFAHVTDQEARTSFAAAHKSVVLFKKFDEQRNDYSGILDFGLLTSWIDEFSFPTLLAYDKRGREKIFKSNASPVMLFADDNERSVAAYQLFEKLAKDQKANAGNIVFAVSQPTDGSGNFDQLSEHVGVTKDDLPKVFILKTSDSTKYKYEQSEITEENILSFYESFSNQKLTKYMKSQEPPASNDEPVQVITGKTWFDLVIKNNKDVLVEFYAPWCGHCQKLEPIYAELAQQLSNNPNLVLAQMDLTANEVENVNVRGYPTVRFYTNKRKRLQPFEMEGEQTEENIVTFLKQFTTYPWVEQGEVAS